MISVIVVNHDGGELLLRCLASLGELSGAELEVVVVDAGSNDGSPDAVRARFPLARVEPLGANPGFGAAVNRGVRLTSGDLLLLLNPDAWLEAGALDRLAARLAGDDRLAAVAPRLLYPDGRRQFVWAPAPGIAGEALQRLRNPFESWPWAHPRPAGLVRRLLGPGFLTAACLLLRRKAFNDVGGFDEAMVLYYEDADLCRRLLARGWRLGEASEAVVWHVRGGSPRPAWLELERRRSQRRYYELHRPRWERRALDVYLERRYRDGAVAAWLRGEDGDGP